MTHGDSQLIAVLGPGNLFDTQVADAIADGTADVDASEVVVDSTSLVGVGTNLQAVLEELDDGIADHLADTADAHDASAVSVLDSAGWTAQTTVEAALAEILSRLPYTIEQSTAVVIDGDSSAGGNGLGVALTATNLVAPVIASKKYLVEVLIQATATSSGGIKLDFTAPAAATMVWHSHIYQGDGNTVNEGNGTPFAVGDASDYDSAALSEDAIKVWGILTVGANAGNLTLRAAQKTAHADNTTVHAESWLRVTPLQ